MRALSILPLLLTVAARPIPTPVTAITDPRSIESAANAAAKPVPLGDLMAVYANRGAVWSPDGKSIVVAPNLNKRFNLWRVDLDRPFPVQLTKSDETQVPAAVTPDNFVLFTEDKGGDEVNDLYAVPLNGGAVVNLTNTPEVTEESPRVSPDGKMIVMSRRAKTGTAVDLVLLDRATGTVRALTKEADKTRLWSAAGWLDGGRTLVANRANITGSQSAIYAIDVATGASRPLSKDAPGLLIFATDASADGRLIAVSSNEATGQPRGGIMTVATGKTAWLKPTPWEQIPSAFSPDGKSLLIQTNADGRTTLTLADAATGAERPLAFPQGVPTAGATQPWRADGKLLIDHTGADAPSDLWLSDPAAGTATQITRFAIASLDPANLPKSYIVAYKSFDGTPVSAILTMPFNLKRDGSNPGIVVPHGGPTGQSQDYFSRQSVMLASRGYVVIQPNFRGSTGYGRAFQDANIKDLGGGDLEDTVGAAKFLAATGFVDAKKIGITGGSYGGFMTLMALGKRPDVFAAGVNQFGIINWFSMWENAVGGLREYQRALVGDPVKDKAAYERQSPLTYAKAIRAPLLNLQGDNDARVPKGQTQEVEAIVKANGGTVEAVFYPAEGHGFTKSENVEDARLRTIEWFDRYLKGAK